MRALTRDLADAAEGARGGGDGAERDDGGRDGDHPPDPRRRAADARGARPPAEPTAPPPPPPPAAAGGGGARRRAARGGRAAATAPAAPAADAGAATGPRGGAGRRSRGRSRATQRFEDVVALIRARRDVSLLVEIEEGVRLVRYAPGRIEFEPADGAPPDLAARLAQRLQLWTGARWGVAVVGSGGAATIAEVRAEGEGRPARRARSTHPMVQAVLAAFPGRRDPRGAARRRARRRRRRRRAEPATRTTTTGIRSIPSQRRAECSRVWDSLATWPRS